MYLTSLFEVLPQQVTIDAIREVETLPRKYKKECEGEEINIQVLAHFSRNFCHAHLISHRYLVKLTQCVFRTYVCFFLSCSFFSVSVLSHVCATQANL